MKDVTEASNAEPQNDRVSGSSNCSPRFYVDSRCGCIAIRDRTLDNPEDKGLHRDTDGVVKFWSGQLRSLIPCATCGHSLGTEFYVPDDIRQAAMLECAIMNKTE